MSDEFRSTAVSNGNLLAGIRADIDMAFLFIDLAQGANDAADADESINSAKNALKSIRNLSGRIQDHGLWQEIHYRSDELETAIASFRRTEFKSEG